MKILLIMSIYARIVIRNLKTLKKTLFFVVENVVENILDLVINIKRSHRLMVGHRTFIPKTEGSIPPAIAKMIWSSNIDRTWVVGSKIGGKYFVRSLTWDCSSTGEHLTCNQKMRVRSSPAPPNIDCSLMGECLTWIGRWEFRYSSVYNFTLKEL